MRIGSASLPDRGKPTRVGRSGILPAPARSVEKHTGIRGSQMREFCIAPPKVGYCGILTLPCCLWDPNSLTCRRWRASKFMISAASYCFKRLLRFTKTSHLLIVVILVPGLGEAHEPLITVPLTDTQGRSLPCSIICTGANARVCCQVREVFLLFVVNLACL